MDWTVVGPILAGLAAVLGGYATLKQRQDTSKATESKKSVDHMQLTLNAMQSHIVTLAADNASLRKNQDRLQKAVDDCKGEKYEQGQRLAAQDIKIADLETRLARYETA